jgi:eukaryotic-like serine/threonine-protein kinase
VMADSVRRVEISSLRLGAVLGSGGQGKVVAVENYLIDATWPAALKTYSGGVHVNTHGLEKITSFPDQLHRNDRDWLMGATSWPWAIATDGGMTRGFLMRVVPDVYRFDFRTRTQGSKTMLSSVEFLLNPDDYVSGAGISISDRDRLNLLGALADTISRLHARGVVVGDLSPKNVLFNLNSYSSCFIIDCDAVALHGESALEQVDTPEWEVPPGERKGTEASDSYKFGLLAIRLFARDQSSGDASAVSALSPEMGRLAALSQNADPTRRPPPGAWVSAIQAAAASASSANATHNSPTQPSPGYQPQPNRPSSWPQPPHQRPVGAQRTARPARNRGAVKAVAFSALGLISLVLILVGLHATHGNNADTGNFSSDTGVSSGGSGSGNSGSGGAPSGGAPSGGAPSGGAPSAQPTNVGIVGISNTISGDSAASAVATMFNTYFTGINNRNIQQAVSVYDPNGIVDPNSSSQVQHFANGVSTTTDSAITLVNIDPSDGSTVQQAEVQFTSNQQAGYGPEDDPDETCTNWDVTYVLTQDSSGNYLINSVSNSSDSSC